jgi:hypothetical protein
MLLPLRSITDDLTSDDLNRGLIGWWPFDDGTPSDFSSFRNHGQLGSGLPRPIEGIVADDFARRGAYLFDGTTNGINVPGFSYVGSTLSIEWWSMPTVSMSGIGPRYLTNSHTDSDNAGFQIQNWPFGGGVQFAVGNGTTYDYILVGVDPPVGSWMHYVCTFNAGKFTVYQNGVSVGTSTSSTVTTMSAGTSILSIGWSAAFSGAVFQGRMDDVRFYNRELSASDVLQRYQRGKQIFPLFLLPEITIPVVAAPSIVPSLLRTRSAPGLGPQSRHTALLNAALPTPTVAPTITGGTLPFMGVG